jgi:hypothetical protein
MHSLECIDKIEDPNTNQIGAEFKFESKRKYLNLNWILFLNLQSGIEDCVLYKAKDKIENRSRHTIDSSKSNKIIIHYIHIIYVIDSKGYVIFNHPLNKIV